MTHYEPNEEWAAKHKDEVRGFFREQILGAIAVHLRCIGDPGHLTREDIATELALIAAVVSNVKQEKRT